MADFKRKTLQLSSGKQIKLYGNSMAIGKSLEIGEGYRPNIFGCSEEQAAGNSPVTVQNPFGLTLQELQELADYNIQLWMDLKKNLYKYGIGDPRVFDLELPPQKKVPRSPGPLQKTDSGPKKPVSGTPENG